MTQSNGTDDEEVNALAESMDLPHRVCISEGLSERLKPNTFIAGLGIQYSERVKTILGIVKANMLLKQNTQEAVLPRRSIVIPLTLVNGPFIKEELVSIKAELTDDDGEKTITLTAILEED